MSVNQALKSEVQQLGLLHTNYQRTKGLLRSCGGTVLSFGEAIVFGGMSPLKGAATKAAGVILGLFARQAHAEGYMSYGKRVGSFGANVTFTTGCGVDANKTLLTELNDAAKKMQVKGVISIVPRQVSNTANFSGASFLPEKVVQCNPMIFYSPEFLKYSIRLDHDPRRRQATTALTSKPSYIRFIATATMATIKNNTYLVMKVAQIGTFYIAKVCADQVAENRQMDPQSWTYAIFTGVCAKIAADTVQAVVHRYMTYRSDRRAVEITGDRQAAVETFKVLQAYPALPSFPLGLLLNEGDKLQFALPSYEARIRHLDPQNEFGGWELPALPELSEKEETQRLLEIREVLPQELRIPLELRANGRLIRALAPQAAYKLAKMAAMAYGTRYLGLKSSALAACGILLMQFYPNLRYLGEITPYNARQRKVDFLREQTGIKKRVIVQQVEGDYEAVGTYVGPGHALVKVPIHYQYEGSEDFILRHEMAHLRHSDTFVKSGVVLGSLVSTNLLLDTLVGFPDSHFQMALQGLLILAVARSALIPLAHRQETRADITAVTYARPEERDALATLGITFFKQEQDRLLTIRQDRNVPLLLQLYRRIIIAPAGDLRIDVAHPSLSSRIRALEDLRGKLQ